MVKIGMRSFHSGRKEHSLPVERALHSYRNEWASFHSMTHILRGSEGMVYIKIGIEHYMEWGRGLGVGPIFILFNQFRFKPRGSFYDSVITVKM